MEDAERGSGERGNALAMGWSARETDLDESPEMSRIRVSITNHQSQVAVDEDRLRRAVRHVFKNTNQRTVHIGVAIVDDAQIHELNRRHLGHDYPTDVLSYPLDDAPDRLEGEVVVSADTALRTAPSYGWSAADELCLYVVHGALHLAGYRDKTAPQRQAMRGAERDVLRELGVSVPSRANHREPPAEGDP